jgi:hypothetical protein
MQRRGAFRPAKAPLVRELRRELHRFEVWCRICSEPGVASVRTATVPGIAPFHWVSVPAGWWLYLPTPPVDFERLHVHCADCVANGPLVLQPTER